MTSSLSTRVGAWVAPHAKQEPTLPEERDRLWNEELTQEDYNGYYQYVWKRAYLIVGDGHEADVVADKVMDMLWKADPPPSKGEIGKYLGIWVRSRALDCVRSPLHRFRMTCRSLTQRNADDEEYEEVPESQCPMGAEEAFFLEGDREHFAQQFAQALCLLNDVQRTCFVFRFVEHMKPEEIAALLHLSPEYVYSQTYRARNRIAKLLRSQENGMVRPQTRERRSSQ